MAIIGLIGWAAIAALHISADIYLRRYRLDVEDNLLARKHNTQCACCCAASTCCWCSSRSAPR